MSLVFNGDLADIAAEVMADDILKVMFQDLQNDPDSRPGFEISKGCIWYKGRLILPPKSKVGQDCGNCQLHASQMCGDSGDFRTYKRLATVCYWNLKGMKKAIEKFV